MATTRNTLKTYFETGDIPTQAQFGELIDSAYNVADDPAPLTDASAFATAAQGAKADTAVQPAALATVATSGSFDDLNNKPTIPSQLADLSDVDNSVASPTDGNILVYRSAGNDWVLEAKPTSGGAPNWGDIGGTLSNQTDLQSALSAKANTVHTHAVSDIVNVATAKLIGRRSAGAGAGEEIGIGGGIELSGTDLRRSALTGDVTAPAGSNTTTIANGAVTEVKLNSSVNASLDLADSALQPAAIGVSVQGYSAVLAATTASFTTAKDTKLSGIATGAQVNTINSAVAGEPTGSDVVLNVVSLTQAEYDAGTKVATTFYIITT